MTLTYRVANVRERTWCVLCGCTSSRKRRALVNLIIIKNDVIVFCCWLVEYLELHVLQCDSICESGCCVWVWHRQKRVAKRKYHKLSSRCHARYTHIPSFRHTKSQSAVGTECVHIFRLNFDLSDSDVLLPLSSCHFGHFFRACSSFFICFAPFLKFVSRANV